MDNISYVIIACYPDKGMKSYGSKSLISFDNKNLLDYQISCINKSQNKKNKYEIIVICDFDINKINKLYEPKIKVIDLNKTNPIHRATQVAKYKNLFFIDYGCVFKPSIIKNIKTNESSIVCLKNNKNNKLEIGCIIDKDNKKLNHMFFDLPDHKFSNIFLISEKDVNTIRTNKFFHSSNLLYFEIINHLNTTGSKIKVNYIENNDFIYFNDMRQKNGISKFINSSKY